MIVNLNSLVQHVIQIKNGIIKHVTVDVKLILSAKKIVVGILAYVFVRIASNKPIIVETNQCNICK